tara:strand:+ start:997 stop:2544 length:1548 start_codon:yes stop_codon:yes gene_type:complete
MSDKIVKHLNFGKDAKDKIYAGINQLTKAVSSTLGASGKCVILEDHLGKPIITKDGVNVADNITLLDPVENMGAVLLREAARKTVSEAGDGTTTATVLAKSIIDHANNIQDTRALKEGIYSALKKVNKYLKDISTPVDGDMIDQVATISANNDRVIGVIIGKAFKEVKDTGIVTMEISDEPETIVEIVDGFQYDKGLQALHYATDKAKKISELKNPLVLIVEDEIKTIRRIQNILEYVIKNKRSLLIIADADPKVHAALAMNKMKGNIEVNILQAPVYGFTQKETLEDLALLTGATVINENLGDDMDLIGPEHLGECTKVKTTDAETIIQVARVPDEVHDIVEQVKDKMGKAKVEGLRRQLEKRVARLSAKVAVVKVGANSEVELKEKSDRVEDAVCATRAAIKEGIVPGGGIALLNAAQKIKSESKYEQILLDAIKAPFNIILENAGINETEILAEEGVGLDVVTGNMVNMIDAGIIDPLLVTKSALTNAVSVATTILSTDCVINNLRINESNR